MIVHYRSRLARFVLYPRFVAVCVGRHVFTWAQTLPPAVLAHEQCHVEQWARYGWLGFLVRYGWYTLAYGYRDNPLEREAQWAEARVLYGERLV